MTWIVCATSFARRLDSSGQVETGASIVIATRNRAGMLADTLDDLLAQRYPADSFEILVVDDDSTDGTAQVVQERANRGAGPAIQYLQQARRGPSSARNEGIRLSHNPLIVFVDDDVRIPIEWLHRFIAAAARHPDTDCLAGRVALSLEGSKPHMCGNESWGESEVQQGEVDKPAILDGVAAANMLVRRSAFDRAGLFLEDIPVYGEETEWVHRLRSHGGQVTYVADVCLWHRRSKEQLRVTKLLQNRYQRGRSWPRIAPYIRRDVSFGEAIGRVLRGMGHFIGKRCWAGALDAAYGSGYARETVALIIKGQGSGYVRWSPRDAGARLRNRLFMGAKNDGKR